MKAIHWLSTVLICLVAGCATNHQVDSDAVAEITKLKKSVWPGIYAARDAEALEAFLADDFVVIAGGKVTPKAEEVAWLKNPGDWEQPEDFAYQISDIVLITADAAIVYGMGESTRTDESGSPCNHTYWSSNTLRRVEGEWYPVMSHVSDVKCTPIEDY